MVNTRLKCWNCMIYFPREKNGSKHTLCRQCYKHTFKMDGTFEQRDPYNKYQKELENLNWVGLNRVRKPSLQVQDFFAKICKIRKKLKILFRITVIIIKLQREAAERAYAPGGLGYQVCLSHFQSLSVN